MVGRWRLVLNGDNEFFDREMEKIDRLIPFSGRFIVIVSIFVILGILGITPPTGHAKPVFAG